MRRFAISATLCLLLAGCKHALEPRVCTLIAIDALTVTVVDAATSQRICDATVTASDGAFTAELRPFGPVQDCNYSGPTERPGRYEVRATRTGYEAAVWPDVVVTADECHVIPVRLAVDMDRSPTL